PKHCFCTGVTYNGPVVPADSLFENLVAKSLSTQSEQKNSRHFLPLPKGKRCHKFATSCDYGSCSFARSAASQKNQKGKRNQPSQSVLIQRYAFASLASVSNGLGIRSRLHKRA